MHRPIISDIHLLFCVVNDFLICEELPYWYLPMDTEVGHTQMGTGNLLRSLYIRPITGNIISPRHFYNAHRHSLVVSLITLKLCV